MINLSDRSLKPINNEDLKRLANIAKEDRIDLFSRILELGELYKDRIICTALCQGAALHYLDGKNGIKDFDVWLESKQEWKDMAQAFRDKDLIIDNYNTIFFEPKTQEDKILKFKTIMVSADLFYVDY